MTASEFYTYRVEKINIEIKKLQSKKSLFGILRFGSILGIIATLYFLWNFNKNITFVVVVCIVIVFIKLIHADLTNKASIKHLQHLLKINSNELLALSGNINSFDGGEKYTPHTHEYANDMDLFGTASLFQFLNRTTSAFGAEKLANWLLYPSNKKTILQRQDAVKELEQKKEFSQTLLAIGKETAIQKSTLLNIENWMQQPTLFTQFKHWKWLRYLLPAIMISICFLYAFDVVSDKLLYPALFVSAVIAFQINKIVAPLHNQLSGLVNELQILSLSIRCIEKEKFNSILLNDLQQNFKSENKNASTKIGALKTILDRLDLRYNIVLTVPLNLILHWNLQQVLDLEKWKSENNVDIAKWFNALAEYEALQSFATITYNNPDWCFPTLADNYFEINANNLGHPLIAKNNRVNNIIDIKNAASVMLITGSNMAGKSTYLRSVGVNAILCMAGAPVCASSFTMSPIQILSSMRVADNLAENTSTFYAELKKLKTIIEKINNGEEVFILLDEILRGTNSLDRHTGTDALIRQLIKQKTPAILATHDVELAKTENEFPTNILNHHFDAQINGEELYFDYKLKNGVCTNMNASLLMKKIGLSI
jgi:DNA mismatch repair ATPase MutS